MELLALFVSTVALTVALAPLVERLLKHAAPEHGPEVTDVESLDRRLDVSTDRLPIVHSRPRNYQGHRRCR